jgi:hypothetical protein
MTLSPSDIGQHAPQSVHVADEPHDSARIPIPQVAPDPGPPFVEPKGVGSTTLDQCRGSTLPDRFVK